jgi:hypothetical protein
MGVLGRGVGAWMLCHFVIYVYDGLILFNEGMGRGFSESKIKR